MTESPYTTPSYPQQPTAPYAYGPPPPGHPAPAGPPPPQATKTRLTFWTRGPGVILVVVALGLVLFGVYAVTGGLKPGSSSANDVDVSITSCTFTGSDSLPSAKVGLTATNHGDRTRSVRVSIEYRDSSGARIDTDTARISGIAPGDTVRTEETTLLDAGTTSGRCLVTSVR
jgi:hypothetical protein